MHLVTQLVIGKIKFRQKTPKSLTAALPLWGPLLSAGFDDGAQLLFSRSWDFAKA